jgi:hypothetical protein
MARKPKQLRQPDAPGLESKSTRRPRVNRAELPIVFIQRPRCPGCEACGPKMLKTTDTEHNGDGSVTRPTTCRNCGMKFLVVAE